MIGYCESFESIREDLVCLFVCLFVYLCGCEFVFFHDDGAGCGGVCFNVVEEDFLLIVPESQTPLSTRSLPSFPRVPHRELNHDAREKFSGTRNDDCVQDHRSPEIRQRFHCRITESVQQLVIARQRKPTGCSPFLVACFLARSLTHSLTSFLACLLACSLDRCSADSLLLFAGPLP